MKTQTILLLIMFISLFDPGFAQTDVKSVPYSVEFLSSDSIIPDLGNRMQLRVVIPIDSIEKYSEIHVAIGKEKGKSDIFYQAYPLNDSYISRDQNFSRANSHIIINLGEFDPDINEQNITIKLQNKFSDSSFIKDKDKKNSNHP